METTLSRHEIDPVISWEHKRIELILGRLKGKDPVFYEVWTKRGWVKKKIGTNTLFLCIARKNASKFNVIRKFRSAKKASQVWDDHIKAIKENKLNIKLL